MRWETYHQPYTLLDYISVQYIELHSIEWRYISLHPIDLQYITFHYTCTYVHTYICTYVHTYIYTYIRTCIHTCTYVFLYLVTFKKLLCTMPWNLHLSLPRCKDEDFVLGNAWATPADRMPNHLADGRSKTGKTIQIWDSRNRWSSSVAHRSHVLQTQGFRMFQVHGGILWHWT